MFLLFLFCGMTIHWAEAFFKKPVFGSASFFLVKEFRRIPYFCGEIKPNSR